MRDPTLQDLEDEGLLTPDQATELACWLSAPGDLELPGELFETLTKAWLLATMDEDATVH